jgi:hypothetical protein
MVSTVRHFSELLKSLIWTLCKIWLVLDKYGPQVNSLKKHHGRTLSSSSFRYRTAELINRFQ